jgi:hypothetical protein
MGAFEDWLEENKNRPAPPPETDPDVLAFNAWVKKTETLTGRPYWKSHSHLDAFTDGRASLADRVMSPADAELLSVLLKAMEDHLIPKGSIGPETRAFINRVNTIAKEA